MIDTLVFSTRAFAPRERFAHYHDFYSPGSDPAALDAPVDAEVHARRLDGVLLYERRLRGLATERLATRVRRNQFDHFTLQLNLAGELHGEGDQGFRAVRPGEIQLLDMAKPMRTRMPDLHSITVSVARSVIESAGASTGALHGLVIPADPAGALGRWLVSTSAGGEARPDPARANDADILAELLGAALSGLGLSTHLARERADLERMNAARRFVEANLFDETLGPVQVAGAAGVSRATLYRLFEGVGGVRKYIQMRRLARLRGSLFEPAGQTVAALAFEAGFVSEHHANRSFRQEFGRPPAEFRRDIRLAIQSDYGDQASRLKRRMTAWYSKL